MEFEGVVYKIMPVTRGTSARGEWQRQDVVFDYNDGGQFSRKICVTFFNKESDVAKLREGETFLVSVNIESREYNGRWYTDIRPGRPGAVGGFARRGGRPAVLSGRGGVFKTHGARSLNQTPPAVRFVYRCGSSFAELV